MLAKSKLNSIETLVSQALIDLEISREKFKAIVNEKEKYEKMKESITMMKSSDGKDKLSENNKNICVESKHYFLTSIYNLKLVLKHRLKPVSIQ